MIKWFRQLDEILRGDATRPSSLQEGRIQISPCGLSVIIVLLAMLYGLCMGSFAMIRTGGQAYMQMIAAAVKVPLLFFLTLGVTFPSLYVFNSLMGSRLSGRSVIHLMIAALGVMLAILASLGPIVVFFSVSTTSYSFMVVLNVMTSAVAGVLGLAFLLRTLNRLVMVQEEEESRSLRPERSVPAGDEPERPAPTNRKVPPAPPETPGVLDRLTPQPLKKVKSVFRTWTIVFAVVGAQMSWLLRPFIGDPDKPFEWFRERESNFFVAVFHALMSLFVSD